MHRIAFSLCGGVYVKRLLACVHMYAYAYAWRLEGIPSIIHSPGTLAFLRMELPAGLGASRVSPGLQSHELPTELPSCLWHSAVVHAVFSAESMTLDLVLTLCLYTIICPVFS